MYLTKKKIGLTLFLLSTFCCRSFAFSTEPHSKDPNLGEFSTKKTREEKNKALPQLSIPYYEEMPERRSPEASLSKEELYKEFRAAQQRDKKLQSEAGDMDVVIAQLKKEYEGKIKTPNRQNKNSSTAKRQGN